VTHERKHAKEEEEQASKHIMLPGAQRKGNPNKHQNVVQK
jgi:hypothetical protein